MSKALISVSNKENVVELAKAIEKAGYEILSTGGTYKVLKDNKIKVTQVSDITLFPECLSGRVKTLHPNVHAGILARRDNKEDMKELKKLKIDTIDIVVVNLYPFKETIQKPNVKLEDVIENIDIGGPTMLRSAAKNYNDVTVVVDPKDYDLVIKELNKNKKTTLETRYYLMYKAFQHTASYDSLISTYFRKLQNIKNPENITVAYEKIQDMRYGENPHQSAAYYREAYNDGKGSLVNAKQLHGKALSFNNINDTNGAITLLKEFTDKPTIVAVKHTNPCAVAQDDTIYKAYKKAYEADPVSIFGGIIASNREIDKKTAEEINKIFIEIVIAPSFSKEAIKILTQKENIRLLELKDVAKEIREGEEDFKHIYGGLLVQDYNLATIDKKNIEYVTNKKPSKKELEDLMFAMKVVKHTKSNAIVIAKNLQTLGIGAGQVNRIWATKQAIEHSDEIKKGLTKGAVLASDAFFPFDDCVQEAAKAGITAIAQPGGSKRDQDSIDACNKSNVSMIFTHTRHFKH